MARSTKELRFAGYVIDAGPDGTTIQRKLVDVSASGDYGADPLGDGTYRMVPSEDVVDEAERNRRLRKDNPNRILASNIDKAEDATTKTSRVLLVWGRGAAQIEAIRDAESDANFIDAEIARSLGDDCERDSETQGYTLAAEAWCVAVAPGAVDTSDLDRDPAVVGYRCHALKGGQRG